MQVVEEFTDEGYSGARLDRPALDRLRDLAEQSGMGYGLHSSSSLGRWPDPAACSVRYGASLEYSARSR